MPDGGSLVTLARLVALSCSGLGIRLVHSQQAGPVVVAELMYHPQDPSGADLAAGLGSASDFEYIKLAPRGDAPVDLVAGTAFTDGVTYTFAAPLTIPAGEFVVVARDQAAFEARYGAAADPRRFVCCFGGKLSNSGELVALAAPDGTELARAEYTDADADADGPGAALSATADGWSAVVPGPHCRYSQPWVAAAAGGGGTGGAVAPPATITINEISYKPPNTVVNEWRDSSRGQCKTDFVWKHGGDLDEFLELYK